MMFESERKVIRGLGDVLILSRGEKRLGNSKGKRVVYSLAKTMYRGSFYTNFLR